MAENQKKVTYLFGAGASANILPVVKDIPQRLRDFHDSLEQRTELWPLQQDKFDVLPDSSKFELKRELESDVKWLADETARHASIDTYAKKLYLTRQETPLRKLKIVLSVYFLWEQLAKLPDPRYDTFIASICDLSGSRIRLPKHLSVISWNYDFQFEKAFALYSSNPSFDFIQNFLNVVPPIGEDIKFGEEFSIIKLNETAALISDSQNGARPVFDRFHVDENRQFVEGLTKMHALLTRANGNTMPMWNFAWENDENQKKVLWAAQSATQTSEVLVIIGYSFPFFNRAIDRAIIQKMEGLKTVYFQANKDDVDKNIERFRSIRPDIDKSRLIPVRDVDQFFLPPEL